MTRLYELARPFAFLTAKGPTIRWYRDALPLLVALVVTAVSLSLPVGLKVVGPDSLSSVMAPLFAGLPGFFIAALAAVATFQGGDLDRSLNGTTIWIEVNGDGMDTPVTLRVFLCHLFAYLTLLSIIAFLACAAATLLASNAALMRAAAIASKEPWDDIVWDAGRAFLIFGMAVLTASLLSCTSLGLYFLAERIHQELE